MGPGLCLDFAYSICDLIIALWSGSLFFLNCVHVLSGGAWTVVELFTALAMRRVLRGLRPEVRAEFVKKLVPARLFFMPALASVSITAGVYLANGKAATSILYR